MLTSSPLPPLEKKGFKLQGDQLETESLQKGKFLIISKSVDSVYLKLQNLMKEVKEDLNKYKVILCSWFEKLKILIFPNRHTNSIHL